MFVFCSDFPFLNFTLSPSGRFLRFCGFSILGRDPELLIFALRISLRYPCATKTIKKDPLNTYPLGTMKGVLVLKNNYLYIRRFLFFMSLLKEKK